MLTDLVLGDGKLSLSIDGGPASFDYFWLRDNARDRSASIAKSSARTLHRQHRSGHPAACPCQRTGDSLLLNGPTLTAKLI